jgi:hypothetical protein
VGVGNVEQDRTGFGHETNQASIRARVIELIGRNAWVTMTRRLGRATDASNRPQ